MNTTTTLPKSPVTAIKDETRTISREAAPSRASDGIARLAGTRRGWPMRLIYLGSDLAAFGLSLGFAKVMANLAVGSLGTGFTTIEAKLCWLWLIGLIAVAVAQQTYAAI